MITAALLVLVVLLVATTPWGRLPRAGRVWAVAALLNVVVFFAMPTTPATSPWRPVVARALAASATLSLALFLLGLQLRRRHTGAGGGSDGWMGPLMLGALPAFFYAFFWLVGPLY